MSQTDMLARLCQESPEFAKLAQERQAHMTTLQSQPRVVAYGLLKAGKSSLLNALTGHLQNEHFATKASRATTVSSELLFHDVIYVDTPGLDANAEDDQEAWRGLNGVDHLLFVHNLRIGAWDVQELAFLQQLATRLPDIVPHITVVLTNAESVTDEREVRLQSFQQALSKLFATCPPMLLTSFPQYQRGILESKPGLTQHSGMEALRQHLQVALDIAAQTRLAQRQAREQQYRLQMLTLVAHSIATRQAQFQSLKNEQQQRETRLCHDFASIATATQQRLSHYYQS